MNLDYVITTFANSFAGRNALIDGFAWQFCNNYILSAVPLTALLVFLWIKNAFDQQRMRLLAGAVAIGTSGLLCRVLQKILPMIGLGRTRPLYDPNLTGIVHWPIGLPPHMLETHSSWPSDSAAWLFGLALLIWLHGGRHLGISALCLAASSSLTRIPMGIHFLSDILCGAALGASMILASQRLPIPRIAYQILKVQRKWPVAFCTALFLATYSLATFAADLRTLASVIYADPGRDADARPVEGNMTPNVSETQPQRQKQQFRVRFAFIDAPEKGQPFGRRAKAAMSELVFGKDVELRPHTIDPDGR